MTELQATRFPREVLVLGGSGQIGRAVIDALALAGRTVHALVHRTPLSVSPAPQGLVHQLADLRSLPGGACGLAISALPLPATAALIPALTAAGIEHVIALSSVAIASWQVIPEEQEKAAAYLAAEQALLASSGDAASMPRISLLRITLVHGNRGNRNLQRLAQAIRRYRVFAIAGAGEGLRQPLHIDDLIDAMGRLSLHHEPGRCAYTIGGSEVLPYRALVRRVFEALDLPPRIVHLPARLVMPALRLGAAVSPRLAGAPGVVMRMAADHVADNSAAGQDLGFAPRGCDIATLRQGLFRTA